MFEKEAEEYAKKVYGNSTEMDYYGIADAFKEGAEFGYNKANEWHYVKDGDLPKEREDVLVVYANKSIGIKHLEWNKEWWGNGTCCSFEYVIAWKEIVLPELKEIKEK